MDSSLKIPPAETDMISEFREDPVPACTVIHRPSLEEFNREVVAHPELGTYGYLWHPGLRMLVCLHCKTTVSPHRLKYHCNQAKHQSPDRTVMKAAMGLVDLRFSKPLPKLDSGQTLQCIKGLEIEDSRQCSMCAYISHVDGTMKNHIRLAHNVKWDADLFRPIKCQTLSTAPAIRFPVLGPERAEDTAQSLRTMLDEGLHNIVSSIEIASTPLPKLSDAWPYLRKVAWDSVVKSNRTVFDLKELYQLGHLAKSDCNVRNQQDNKILKAVSLFFTNMEESLEVGCWELRQMMLSEKKGDVAPKAFKLLQAETMARYARTLASFISFLCKITAERERYRDHPSAMVASNIVRSFETSLNEDFDSPGVQQSLANLVISVLLVRGTFSRNADAQYPVFHFLALYNMRPEGTFPPPNLVTHRWPICNMERNRSAQELRPHLDHYTGLLSAQCALPAQELDFIWHFLTPIHGAQATNFSHLLSVKGWMAYHGHEYSEEPPCQWEDTQYTSLSYRGHVISIQGITTGISQALDDADCILDTLCLGESKAIGGAPVGLIDVKDNSHQGYSFLTLADNNLYFAKSPLLARIATVDDQEEQFFYGAHQGKALPNYPKIHQYLRDCKRFLTLLAALMHVTAGGPPGGEEAIMTRLFNDGNTFRNLFWIRGRMAWILFYNKSESQGGARKPYPRFLHKRISELLFKYLTVVRGFEAVLVQVVGSSQLAQDHMKWLFVDTGKRWTASAYSDAVQSFFQEYLGQPIALRAYRQIQVTLAKKHLMSNPILWDDKAFAKRMEHEQAGHSTETGSSRYGNVQGQILQVGEDREMEFEICSVNWQRLVMPGMCDNPILFRGSEPEKDMDVHQSESEIIRSNLRHNDFGFALQYDVRALLKLLRELFAMSPTVRFKDIKQADACAAVIQQSVPGTPVYGQNLLIVLPTGMGKTVTWLLPHVENPALFTIVLVPLNSLKDDLTHRVQSYQKFNVYGGEVLQPLAMDGLRPGIIICSYDQLEKDGVRGEISRCSQRIARIVFEEAHLSIMSKGFRPCMQHMSLATHLGCPVTVITATCPPTMTKALRAFLAISDWKEIRLPCIRRNIIYEVIGPEKSAGSVPERVHQYLQNHLRNSLKCSDAQILIFASTIAIGQKLEQLSGYPFYHGQLPDPEKTRLMNDFRKGLCSCMIATNAFGAGIDIQNVEVVIHAGAPWDFVSFAQESGRCGRSERLGLSIVIPSNVTSRVIDSPDIFGQRAFADWLQNTTQCRRKGMADVLDGSSIECSMLPDAALCDICSTVLGEAPALQRYLAQGPNTILRRLVGGGLFRAHPSENSFLNQFFLSPRF